MVDSSRIFVSCINPASRASHARKKPPRSPGTSQFERYSEFSPRILSAGIKESPLKSHISAVVK